MCKITVLELIRSRNELVQVDFVIPGRFPESFKCQKRVFFMILYVSSARTGYDFGSSKPALTSEIALVKAV